LRGGRRRGGGTAGEIVQIAVEKIGQEDAVAEEASWDIGGERGAAVR
jgi:hypothetical protein